MLVHLTSLGLAPFSTTLKETIYPEITSELETRVTFTCELVALEIGVARRFRFRTAMASMTHFATPATSSSAATAFAVAPFLKTFLTNTTIFCELKRF